MYIARHAHSDEMQCRRDEDAHSDQCDCDTDDDTHDRTRDEQDMIQFLTHLISIEDDTELWIGDHDDDTTDIEHDRSRRIDAIDDSSPIRITNAK